MCRQTHVPGLFALLLLAAACSGDVKPAVVRGVDACAHCQMVIDVANQACGYVVSDEFKTFDSPLCLLAAYEAARKADRPPTDVYFADYRTGVFVRADSVRFLETRHQRTVMDCGIVCLGDDRGAEDLRTQPGERILDWPGLRLERGIPDRSIAVRVSATGIEPDRIGAELGDLVELQISGTRPGTETRVAFRGYEEIGTIQVPTDGEAVQVRFWASRPGDGFPIVDAAGGTTLGRLAIAGAHTLDEEARNR